MKTVGAYASESLGKIIEWLISKEFIGSVLIIIGTALILCLVAKLTNYSKKVISDSGVKDTAAGIIFDTIRVGVILVAAVMLLQINGVNVTSLIAGLGVMSVVAGLALQDTLKDIIMGVHILLDHFYEVGDCVKINSYEGTVIDFNIRTTKLKSFADESIIMICNRDVDEVVRCSNWLDIDVPLDYGADVDKINAVLSATAEKIKSIPGITECKYLGTQDFLDSAITYRLRIYTSPDKKYAMRRASIQLIQKELNTNALSIPFNKLDVSVFQV